MFDLIKNKYDEERRGNIEAAPIAVEMEQGNKPNAAAIVLLLFLYIIPVVLIIYGAIHLKDCPAENMVAISLIVLGGLNLLSRLLSSPNDFRDAFGFGGGQKNLCLICFNLILQLVITGWSIALWYWIFSMKPDTKPEDHDLSNYCALEFYRAVFWGSVVGLVLFCLMFIGICCASCYIASKI